jgi:hypothetical protein
MRKVVIVPETGECLTEIFDGDRIIRGSSIEALKELESAPKGETYTKIYRKVIPMIVDCKLTAAELLVFMYLASNLRYISNVAKFPNGKLIMRENMQHDLRLSEITVKRSLYRLIKEGLIVEANTIEGKVFIVNPFVMSVGDRINKTVYDLFRKSKWARW